MQISFDPLQQEEAAAVRAMLDVLQAQQVGTNLQVGLYGTAADHDAEFPTITGLTIAQLREAGHLDHHKPAPLTANDPLGGVPPSAAPLVPPAPSTAAADLFSTAPAAPQDGQATQPAVPAPPVPVPSVPTAPAASPSLADVDSTGLPWDERIHSGTKAKNADGTWRARRGMNDAAKVKEVEAELRALMALSGSPLSTLTVDTAEGSDKLSQTAEAVQSATAPAVPSPPIPIPPAPGAMLTAGPETSAVTVTTSPSDTPNAAPATSAPPTAPIPSPPVPPAPTAEGSTVPDTFGPLMTYLAKSVTEGKTTEAQIHEVFGRHGIEKGKFGQLISKPDVLSAIVGELRLMGI